MEVNSRTTLSPLFLNYSLAKITLNTFCFNLFQIFLDMEKYYNLEDKRGCSRRGQKAISLYYGRTKPQQTDSLEKSVIKKSNKAEQKQTQPIRKQSKRKRNA